MRPSRGRGCPWRYSLLRFRAEPRKIRCAANRSHQTCPAPRPCAGSPPSWRTEPGQGSLRREGSSGAPSGPGAEGIRTGRPAISRAEEMLPRARWFARVEPHTGSRAPRRVEIVWPSLLHPRHATRYRSTSDESRTRCSSRHGMMGRRRRRRLRDTIARAAGEHSPLLFCPNRSRRRQREQPRPSR